MLAKCSGMAYHSIQHVVILYQYRRKKGWDGLEYIMGLSGSDDTTSVNIATLSGVIVQSFTVGAINFFFANEDQISHNMAEAFVTAQLAGYPIKNCRQVCAGVAGLQGRGATFMLAPKLQTVMRKCGYTGDALLTGDEHVALAGALNGTTGAILIADKSSVCFGQNATGGTHRTGGLGELADDDGSSYAIGREILRAAARAGDGRGPVTNLTSHVYRHFKLTGASDLACMLRKGSPTNEEICGLSSCIPSACQAMDKVAIGIVESAVDQLTSLVEPVINRLRLQQGVLAVAGRVLLEDVYIGVAFKKRMSIKYPDLKCVPPRRDGGAGAVLLAKERLTLRGGSR